MERRVVALTILRDTDPELAEEVAEELRAVRTRDPVLQLLVASIGELRTAIGDLQREVGDAATTSAAAAVTSASQRADDIRLIVRTVVASQLLVTLLSMGIAAALAGVYVSVEGGDGLPAIEVTPGALRMGAPSLQVEPPQVEVVPPTPEPQASDDAAMMWEDTAADPWAPRPAP